MNSNCGTNECCATYNGGGAGSWGKCLAFPDSLFGKMNGSWTYKCEATQLAATAAAAAVTAYVALN